MISQVGLVRIGEDLAVHVVKTVNGGSSFKKFLPEDMH